MEITIAIIISVIADLFILFNFIFFALKGRIYTNKILWNLIQICAVLINPIIFLDLLDLSFTNDCCGMSAIFSPTHRPGIYILIFACILAFIANMIRTEILPPIPELIINVFLILGLGLNILFFFHFGTTEDGYIFPLIGNIPIILIFLMTLYTNQKNLSNYISENKYSSDTTFGRLCLGILKLKPITKYPLLLLLTVPIMLLLTLFLMLFGQKPDTLIRAFTDTYKHGFSQLDYQCDNVRCGGHFLCSVGANGHQKIVKPIRYGIRNGAKIICIRQLLICNAFEELVEEYFPRGHHQIRKTYNKVGDAIHRHYHPFNNKYLADAIYIVMKPLELFFLIILYSVDKKPE